jgi:hypothetical protein
VLRVEILAAAAFGLAEAELPDGLEVEVADVGRDDLVIAEAAALGRVAGGRDGAAAQVDLVGRNPEGRAHGRPDLGGVVRKSREICARQRRRYRELRSHELDTVAGIAGETDDDRLYVSVSIHKK